MMTSNWNESGAVTYCRVEFHCQINQRTISIHQADCKIDNSIIELKRDLEEVFGIKADQQEWYIRDTEMYNEFSLQYYGIRNNSSNRNPFKIYVKNR